MNRETEAQVKAAQTLLEKNNKLEEIIAVGVMELPSLIENALTTERVFRQLEAQGAVDGAPPAGLPAARKAAETAKAALEQASLRLNGLRANLAGLGGALAEGYDKLAAEIPKHNAAVAEAFKAEWEAALASWSALLGRRAAVERVLGKPLTLPDPVAAAADIGDMAKPHEALASLVAAIDVIAGNDRTTRWQTLEKFYYDPKATYRISGDPEERRGFPNGSLVIDSCFEPGRLRQLVALDHARPVTWADLVAGGAVASKKAGRIEKEKRDAELAEEERRLRDRSGDENLKRSGRVVVPQYHEDAEKRQRTEDEVRARVPIGTLTRP